MKTCNNCHHQVNDHAKYCRFCGSQLEMMSNLNPEAEESSVGYSILSFFFPIIGIIFFAIWHDEFPKRAKACAISGSIGFVIGIVLFFIINFLLYFFFFFFYIGLLEKMMELY